MSKTIQPLVSRIPPDAWDSHMHILDPETYPLSPTAIYRPSVFSLAQALDFEASVGIHNIVLVQPSIYGNDNACLIDALRELGTKHGRGVVAFDPKTITTETLKSWHDVGIRAVRLNIQSTEVTIDAKELECTLRSYADAVRPYGWAVQVYVPMHMIKVLESIIPTLDIRFCIDHLGCPSVENQNTKDPYSIPGFASLARLLKNGYTYVKFSAPYRMSLVADYSDIEPVAREILRIAGTTRVVFATDWPHTRFEGLDIRPWMEMALEWCGDDQHLIQRLFTGNARDLWDVPPTT